MDADHRVQATLTQQRPMRLRPQATVSQREVTGFQGLGDRRPGYFMAPQRCRRDLQQHPGGPVNQRSHFATGKPQPFRWLPGWPKWCCNSGSSGLEKLEPPMSQMRGPSQRARSAVAARNVVAIFSRS
ncbi:MAG: hypothetical protein IRY99_22580 [Isosphaeraceae bacterium]|nr:hypothetical protein [Isosphaeraceae bacterium]